MGKNDRVTTDVLEKICLALNCDVGDIMEFVDDVSDAESKKDGGCGDEG